MLSRVDSMLRGKVLNDGAPLSYSARIFPRRGPFQSSYPIHLFKTAVLAIECDLLQKILRPSLLRTGISLKRKDRPISRCKQQPGDTPSASNLVRQEITQTISHASSTFEGSLVHGNTSAPDVACQGYPAHVGTIEGASALEGVAEDNPAPEGAAEDDPAPEGASLAPLWLLLWMFMSDHYQLSLRSQC
jgi:hypothetical protein